MTTFEGFLAGSDMAFALVCSRFNALVVEKLEAGARDALVRHGVARDAIDTVWVPGAFELPLAAQRLAQSSKYDALVCLGCVIRGETPHFDVIVSQSAAGIRQVALDTGVPVGFGVLTTEDLDQALARAGSKAGNKGAEAALSTLEMVDLLRRLPP